MTSLATSEPSTTEQKFNEYNALYYYEQKDFKYVPSEHPSQSSRLNYTDNSLNYGKKLEIVEQTTIETLINFNYTLVKPVKVKITKDFSGVIGDIEELELYAFGDNEFEVLRELNEELVFLFEDLIEKENKILGKFPKKWKSILNKYIKNNR